MSSAPVMTLPATRLQPTRRSWAGAGGTALSASAVSVIGAAPRVTRPGATPATKSAGGNAEAVDAQRLHRFGAGGDVRKVAGIEIVPAFEDRCVDFQIHCPFLGLDA